MITKTYNVVVALDTEMPSEDFMNISIAASNQEITGYYFDDFAFDTCHYLQTTDPFTKRTDALDCETEILRWLVDNGYKKYITTPDIPGLKRIGLY